MKVYACPKEVPAPTPDYSNYDHNVEQEREREHQNKLAEWLRANGYDGPHTGKVYSTPVADGHASYMFGDKGRSGILIHLPYGDAWESRDVSFLTKAEIVSRLIQGEKVAKLFGTDAESDHGRWWAARKIGEIVHYSDGFGQFIRGEIIEHEGKKKMRPTALVGNWKAHDLPRIGADGNLHESYHVKEIREGKPMQPNFSNMVEAVGISANDKRNGVQDPRGQPAIDLTPPKPDANQIEAKRLSDLRAKVMSALNNEGLFQSLDLRDSLLAARKILANADL
jgi:hypothetical protein